MLVFSSMRRAPYVMPPQLAARQLADDVARAGNVIAERYQLEHPLERGAMGTVWRAKHLLLKTPVAIKFLEPELVGDSEVEDRFMQEARSAAAIRSTHVVQVLDCGRERGTPFIVMELLEGENLESRLGKRGRLTPKEILDLFVHITSGIGRAHALGVVHRDLKPGNIFIAREGEQELVKLVDFGIAKVDPEALQISQVIGTQRGALLGTPQYMSPEQIRGKSNVDHRTDLWALAVIACECLTGQLPFSGRSLCDLTVQICTEKPLAPSLLGPVPRGFDGWFFKATQMNPEHRFACAEEMFEALKPILENAGSDARLQRALNRSAERKAHTHIRTLAAGLWMACARNAVALREATALGLMVAWARCEDLWHWATQHLRAFRERVTRRGLPNWGALGNWRERVHLRNVSLGQKRLLGATLVLAFVGSVLMARAPSASAPAVAIQPLAAQPLAQPSVRAPSTGEAGPNPPSPVAPEPLRYGSVSPEVGAAELDALAVETEPAASPAARLRPANSRPRSDGAAQPPKLSDPIADIARQIMEGRHTNGKSPDRQAPPSVKGKPAPSSAARK
jgi:tRNA A-37 threonylcarbamoyl transferase component Bud32